MNYILFSTILHNWNSPQFNYYCYLDFIYYTCIDLKNMHYSWRHMSVWPQSQYQNCQVGSISKCQMWMLFLSILPSWKEILSPVSSWKVGLMKIIYTYLIRQNALHIGFLKQTQRKIKYLHLFWAFISICRSVW